MVNPCMCRGKKKRYRRAHVQMDLSSTQICVGTHQNSTQTTEHQNYEVQLQVKLSYPIT